MRRRVREIPEQENPKSPAWNPKRQFSLEDYARVLWFMGHDAAYKPGVGIIVKSRSGISRILASLDEARYFIRGGIA